VADAMVSLDTNRFVNFPGRFYYWQHGKMPDVVITIVGGEGGLAERMAAWAAWSIPRQAVFDGERILAMRLVDGAYVPCDSFFPGLGLRLVKWRGEHNGVRADFARWRTREGSLIPTPAERAALADAKLRRSSTLISSMGVEADRLDSVPKDLEHPLPVS
jgi:hypothetical protein